MSARQLTPEAARAILARESGEVFQPLMEITGPGLVQETEE